MHFAGSYTEAEGFQGLHKRLSEWEEKSFSGQPIGRLYYLALPPSAYSSVVEGVKLNCDLKDPPPKFVLSPYCSLWLLLKLNAFSRSTYKAGPSKICRYRGVMHRTQFAASLLRHLQQRLHTKCRLTGLRSLV